MSFSVENVQLNNDIVEPLIQAVDCYGIALLGLMFFSLRLSVVFGVPHFSRVWFFQNRNTHTLNFMCYLSGASYMMEWVPKWHTSEIITWDKYFNWKTKEIEGVAEF